MLLLEWKVDMEWSRDPSGKHGGKMRCDDVDKSGVEQSSAIHQFIR